VPGSARPASWVQRFSASLAGSLVGVCLFFLTLWALWWNEQSSVRSIRALLEARRVVSEAACSPSALLSGKLVHIDCPITSVPTLTDGDFGVSVQTLGLRRRVESYQWVQHEHKRCWKDDPNAQEEQCEVTFSYSMEWRDSHQASHTFHQPQGHTNPPWSVSSSWQRAPEAHAGGYLLPTDLANRLNREADLSFTDSTVVCQAWADGQGGSEQRCPWSSTGTGLYYRAGTSGGPLRSAPAVGDVRVSWSRVVADRVSVLAQQQASGERGATLRPFVARSGKAVQLFAEGSVSAEALLSASEASNRFWTWALRGFFTYLNWTALCWIFQPLSVAAAVLPLIGRFVSDVAALGISLAALLTSALVCSLTVAVAWAAVRPEVALPLLLVALGAGGSLATARDKARRRRGAAAAAENAAS